MAIGAVGAGAILGGMLLGSFGLRALSARFVRQAEAACPPEGQFLDIAGRRVHYREEGDGPELLMIHGLTGNGRNLTYALAPALRAHFRVITLDRPGAGYSDPVADAETSLHGQASLVARFIEAKGLQRPLVLGHSLGGAVALALAIDHPRHVRGLVLVSALTHPQHLPPPVFLSLAVRPAFLRRWVAECLAVPLGMLGRRHILRQVFAPDPVPEDFALRGGGLLAMRPESFYAASCELQRINGDLRGMVAHYPRLTLPIGLIHGDRDPILALRGHGEAMAKRVPGLLFESVEGRGHMLPVNAVDRIVSLTRQVDSLAKS